MDTYVYSMATKYNAAANNDLELNHYDFGERVKGIEPSCPAWEAGVLPLNYTRGRKVEGRGMKDEAEKVKRINPGRRVIARK